MIILSDSQKYYLKQGIKSRILISRDKIFDAPFIASLLIIITFFEILSFLLTLILIVPYIFF